MTMTSKRYVVDLWDYYDGWCMLPEFDTDLRFDDRDKAIAVCKVRQAELPDIQGKDVGSHYGVIDLYKGGETFCSAREGPMASTLKKCKLCDNKVDPSNIWGWCDKCEERFAALWHGEPSPLKVALKEIQGKPEKVKVTVEELRKLL